MSKKDPLIIQKVKRVANNVAEKLNLEEDARKSIQAPVCK
jgi:hypothetical protein